MLAEPQWALIFGAAKKRGARWPSVADVDAFKREVEAALSNEIVVTAPTHQGRRVSQRGIDLIHSFETCKLDAYKDPGSKNGLPITIGWGSTSDMEGKPIKLGARWTQEQCDAQFAADLARFSAKVAALLGDTPTTQHQFDAMVSLAYNIGIGSANRSKPGGFTRSSVLRLHKAGDHKGAARAFLLWNKNDGKVMRGLTRRRLAEADLYDEPEGGA